MVGLDNDVITVQISVLEDAVTLHRVELQDAEQGYVAALTAKQRALDAAAGASAAAERFARVADQHRAAIRDYSRDIAEFRTMLTAVPPQRVAQ